MENRGTLTRGLAVSGTIFAWLPILVTVLTSVAGTIRNGRVRVDYPIAGQLFSGAFVRALLLFLGPPRAPPPRGVVGVRVDWMLALGWGLAAAAIALVGSQTVAVIAGLASGKIGMSGWPWALVVTGIAAYALALIVIGIGGVLLLRDLYPDKI